MSVWHYTTSRTVAADLKRGDWVLVGDECFKVILDPTIDRSIVHYVGAYGDGVSVEYQDDHGNATETWPHSLPADHVITLIHFTERDA